jgi:hypothetical protein
VYFGIAPMLQMNISDTDLVYIQVDIGDRFTFLFGASALSSPSGNIVSIHPGDTRLHTYTHLSYDY